MYIKRETTFKISSLLCFLFIRFSKAIVLNSGQVKAIQRHAYAVLLINCAVKRLKMVQLQNRYSLLHFNNNVVLMNTKKK